MAEAPRRASAGPDSARSRKASPGKASPGKAGSSPRREQRLADAGAQISSKAGAASGNGSGGSQGVHFQSAYAPQELSKGVDSLVQQLANVRAGNVDLQSRLELQNKEVALLQLSGIDQQRALLSFQQKLESDHRAEVQAVEARGVARVADTERKLRADLESCQQQLQRGNSERQKLVAELETLRREMGQEKEARREAQSAEVAARETEQSLQAELQQASRERQLLQTALTEQSLALRYKDAEYAELQDRYKRHRRKAHELLSREKEKLEVVGRLDGVLPRNIIMKAVSD
mmetsp:Transcript_23219/g.41935  ORF Transcript_23219/g.41935 Transcript_23219/m.41935 type:complete len:290 (+) Transcript_23219:73-942(+)